MGKLLALAALLCFAQAQPTGSIEGTVRDRDGSGVPGVRVAVVSLMPDGPILRETVTSAGGEYEFLGLFPGSYVVEHELGPWYGAVEFARGVQVDCTELRDGEAELLLQRVRQILQGRLAAHPHRIDVNAGSATPFDPPLPDHTPVTVALRDSGGPVPEARVLLIASGPEAMRAWPATLGGPESRTDETGTVTFARVRPGSYCPCLRIGDWEILCDMQEVTARDSTALAVELGPYCVRVRLLDAHGEPIESGQPVIQNRRGFPRVGLWPTLVLDAQDGWFDVPYAVAGDYVVEATAGAGNATARTDVMVDPLLPRSEATLHMPPMGSVLVQVPQRAGGGESEVRIRIRQKGADWSVARTVAWPGEARFDCLTEGTYIVGEHEGAAFLPFRGTPVEVEVKADEVSEVTLVVSAEGE